MGFKVFLFGGKYYFDSTSTSTFSPVQCNWELMVDFGFCRSLHFISYVCQPSKIPFFHFHSLGLSGYSLIKTEGNYRRQKKGKKILSMLLSSFLLLSFVVANCWQYQNQLFWSHPPDKKYEHSYKLFLS